MTALVFAVILRSKSARSTWKVFSVGVDTTSLPPAFSTNTRYSVKKGANAMHSSPSFRMARSVTVRDAAAPQVM